MITARSPLPRLAAWALSAVPLCCLADLPCNQPGPLAQTYAVQVVSHPWDDAIGHGKRTHSYQFTVPQAAKLCSIGYEAPGTPPATYQFKLYNCSSGVPVAVPGASVTVPAAVFSPGLQYFILPNTSWPLMPATCYELRRKVVGPATVAQRTGRRLDNETTYPINAVPSLSILGTDLFNGAGPQIVDQALPLIDFGTR
jgi:hypothetical protein